MKRRNTEFIKGSIIDIIGGAVILLGVYGHQLMPASLPQAPLAILQAILVLLGLAIVYKGVSITVNSHRAFRDEEDGEENIYKKISKFLHILRTILRV